jgi:5,10-methylene-tetrahydrofolate dehydrogenase/methenyl tetrahydrofolate cyclohydrolase
MPPAPHRVEIESVGTSNSRLSSRIAALSGDPSIHGIRVSGWHLHRGEETYEFNELAPDKDVDCKTPRRMFELLSGGSMYSEPSVGAIWRLIRSVLKEKSLPETTIAVLGQFHDPVMKILAAKDNFGTVKRSASIRSENIDLVRQADVIVTSCGLDRQQLRQDQVAVDRSGRWDSREMPADLIEMLPLMRAFATWRAIFTLAKRVPFENLLLGIIWRQGGLDPRNGSQLDLLLQ